MDNQLQQQLTQMMASATTHAATSQLFQLQNANANGNNISDATTTEPMATISLEQECVDIKAFLWSNSTDLTSLPAVMGIFALLYTFIVLTSLLGNLLVILSVCQHKSLQSVRNLFIVSLSVSDIVISVVSGTITPIMAFTKIWPFGDLLCKWVPVIQGASLCFSTLTLTSISIDRFLLIVLPLRPSIQKRCACRLVALNSVLALTISLPMLFKQKMVDWPPFCGQFCTEDWSNSQLPRSIYGTFVFIMQFIIPFLVISSCYVMISVKINSGILAKRASTEIARYSGMNAGGGGGGGGTARVGKLSGGGPEEGAFLLKNGNGTGSRQSTVGSGGGGANDAMKVALEQRKSVLNRKLRTNRMLIGMVAVFFCCWAPSVLFNFLRDYQWLPDWVMAQEYLFGIITHCISMSSTIWNPVLYALLNEQFRTAFSEQFMQIRVCLRAKQKIQMRQMANSRGPSLTTTMAFSPKRRRSSAATKTTQLVISSSKFGPLEIANGTGTMGNVLEEQRQPMMNGGGH